MPVEKGRRPDPFEAVDAGGETVTVAFGAPTILFFYPEDGSPGCRTEAEQFEREHGVAADAGVAVYGISRDDPDSHREFADRFGLSYPLLADPEGTVGDRFGIDRQPDGSYRRTTVVVVDGAVWRVYEGVDPDGHARTVLGDLLDAGVVSLDP